MKPNYFILSLPEIKEYVRLHKESGDSVGWSQILELKHRPKVTSIQVIDEDGKTELASVGWGWNNDEIKFGKIQVDKSLRRQGIADTMMKMFLEIAKFYKASRITGVIDGDPFLWDWYPKFGFSVHDGNKLLMELSSLT
jgi:predicted GNAT family N-acyltransferase